LQASFNAGIGAAVPPIVIDDLVLGDLHQAWNLTAFDGNSPSP